MDRFCCIINTFSLYKFDVQRYPFLAIYYDCYTHGFRMHLKFSLVYQVQAVEVVMDLKRRKSIGRRKRDIEIHALFRRRSSVLHHPQFLSLLRCLLHTNNGSGSPRSQDLRVMGRSFPVPCSRSARYGETVAPGH